jgi:hypothetical protein
MYVISTIEMNTANSVLFDLVYGGERILRTSLGRESCPRESTTAAWRTLSSIESAILQPRIVHYDYHEKFRVRFVDSCSITSCGS